MIVLTPHARGTIVPVHAQPGARRNGVFGERAGALRVAVTAPPEKGKANTAIARVLAEALGCGMSQVELLSPATARAKKFLVHDLTIEEARRRVDRLIAAPGGSEPSPVESPQEPRKT